MGDEEDVASQRAVIVQRNAPRIDPPGELVLDGEPAGNTEGDTPYNEMLRDRMVLGVKDDTVRKKLISHGNTLTLAQAVRICHSDEVTSSVMQTVRKSGSGTIGVDADNSGGQRDPGDLLFNDEFHLGQLTVDAWKAEIEVNGHNTSFKLDTGADGTVISDKVPWLKDIQLEKTNSHLCGLGDQELHVLGSFDAELKYKAWKHKETVFVIRNQATSLLSRKACKKLKLVTYNVKEQAEITKDMLRKFSELFKGLGKLKDYSYSISLKKNYRPVCIYTPRKVLLPLREKTKRKLEEMVVQGVISPMAEATEWCSGMVPVRKPSGECPNLRGFDWIKQSCESQSFPMPSVNENLALLGAAKYMYLLNLMPIADFGISTSTKTPESLLPF
ncbi:uncharacterized protein [Watersipora subatra]|uniref:uncharacterized protein n=1 Tax=Watersipora subatra TaxID=2589382 RepID=UPI00355C6B37